MYFGEKAVMKLYIKKLHIFLNKYPNIKEWGWFLLLAGGGMSVFLMVSYPIKLLIKGLGKS